MQRNKAKLAKRVKEVVTNGDKNIHVIERVESLILELVDGLDSESLAEQMTPDKYAQSVTKFEKMLDHYGAEGDLSLFDRHAVVESISPYKSYRVVWSAPYELFLSMMLRLQAGDLIQLKHTRLKHAQSTIHMIPGHSLKFAWVDVADGSARKPNQPFLVYCASRLANQDALLLKLILSKRISAEQCLEIAAALCEYHAAISPYDQREMSGILVKQMLQFLNLEQALKLPGSVLLKDYVMAQEDTAHNREIYTNALPMAVCERDAEMVLLLLDHHAELNDCYELSTELEFSEITDLLLLHQLQQAIEFEVPFREEAFKRLKQQFVNNQLDSKILYAVFDALTDYLVLINNLEANSSELKNIASLTNDLLVNIHKTYSEAGAFDNSLLIDLGEKTKVLVQALQQQKGKGNRFSFFRFFGGFGESEQVTQLKSHMQVVEMYAPIGKAPEAKRIKPAY